MLKGLGIVAGGIFVGAIGAEIVRKACPDGLDKLYSKVGELTGAAKEAFLGGYHNALGTKEPSPVGA